MKLGNVKGKEFVLEGKVSAVMSDLVSTIFLV